MSDEMKSCPFCGGEPERLELTDEDNFGGSVICCKGCGASSPVHFEFKENLLDSWNRRAAPEPGEAEGMVLTASEAEKICKRLEFDASWDKCGSGYYSLKRQLAAAPPPPEDTHHGR